jgi:hypothetical protein
MAQGEQMKPKFIIFAQEYHGFESLADIERDVGEALSADFNPLMDDVPGEFQGTITVTIHYTPAEDE